MMIVLVLIAALLGVLILAFGPERRKQYNEFRSSIAVPPSRSVSPR
jgi:hypothetical protein